MIVVCKEDYTPMAQSPIILAGLMPHAPVLIPSVAGTRLGDVRRSSNAMSTLAARVVLARPDAVVLISPHSPRRHGAFGVWHRPELRASFTRFCAGSEHVELPCDLALAETIEKQAARLGLRSWSISEEMLDHGAGVPLWYLQNAGWSGATVVLSLAQPGYDGLELLGRAIAHASSLLGKQVAVIASGDMSHRLSPGSPCGFEPRGAEFDRLFVRLLRAGSYDKLGKIDAGLLELAAEDSFEPTILAISAAGGSCTGAEVLSYEGPFGVGYCVAVLYSSPERSDVSVVDIPERLEHCEDLPELARCAIASHLQGVRAIPALSVRGEPAREGCVFVKLSNPDGSLRGCMGNLRPTEAHLAAETWKNAVSAAFGDSRFPPLLPDELPGLLITVQVLGDFEPVSSEGELNPRLFGIVGTSSDGRKAVLLPDIEGVDTVARQLAELRRKAGVGREESLSLHRFRVRCFL